MIMIIAKNCLKFLTWETWLDKVLFDLGSILKKNLNFKGIFPVAFSSLTETLCKCFFKVLTSNISNK